MGGSVDMFFSLLGRVVEKRVAELGVSVVLIVPVVFTPLDDADDGWGAEIGCGCTTKDVINNGCCGCASISKRFHSCRE